MNLFNRLRKPASKNTGPRSGSRRPAGTDASFSAVESNRWVWLLVAFGCFALALVGRLAYVQLMVADYYAESALNARTSTIQVMPHRGTIYDRNGVVLAISVDATTVYADPAEIKDPVYVATQLSAVLGGKVQDYQAKISQEGARFVYIARQADVALADQLKALGLEGIHFLEDSRREYPNGQVGGQVVGFCNRDGQGVCGLEYQYDQILAGNVGSDKAERSQDGNLIPGGARDLEESVDGQDIVVSLDIVMQEAVENILQDYAQRLGVNTGSVLMDASTGEIYAAASTPLFNPANTSKVAEGATSIKPLTNAIEPGSIFKAVTSLRLLETGTMGPNSKLFCPEELEANGYTVTDSHERPAETMTLKKIMAESSNIGVSLATEKMGFDELNKAISQYGLDQASGVDYPGETAPTIADFNNWSKIQGYNMSFGQGLTQTPLQMVRFYGALINQGQAVTPHFLVSKPQSNEQVEYETRQIITNEKALKNQIKLLEGVVQEGTGTPAQIDGYHPAGKTGTAEVASDAGGYKQGVYNISFVGFLSQSNSNLVCYTGAYELPAEGNVSPIFKDIMLEAIDRYGIASE